MELLTTKEEAFHYLARICLDGGTHEDQTKAHELILYSKDLPLEDLLRETNAIKAEREGDHEQKENQKQEQKQEQDTTRRISTNPYHHRKTK